MAITQTSFDQYSSIGYHGQLNTDFPMWIESPIAEGGYIPFGVAVAYGTGDNQAVVATTDTDAADIIGITVRNHAVAANAYGTPYDQDTAFSGFQEGRPMSVLKKGRMYVTVADGSARGDAVYVTAGGEITSAADDGGAEPVANVALPNAKFVKTVGAGEITEIEIG